MRHYTFDTFADYTHNGVYVRVFVCVRSLGVGCFVERRFKSRANAASSTRSPRLTLSNVYSTLMPNVGGGGDGGGGTRYKFIVTGMPLDVGGWRLADGGDGRFSRLDLVAAARVQVHLAFDYANAVTRDVQCVRCPQG